MDSYERMDERDLPQKDKFYSKLNKTHISDEDYILAKQVWNTLEIKTLREYTKLI